SEVRDTGRGLKEGPAGACRMVDDTEPLMEPNYPLRKRVKALDAVLGLIQNCPQDDPQSAQLLEDMEKIRAKFRQVCSMLSVPADFKEYMKTSEGTSF
ncbi:hypothetical protein L3Q82_009127, partial [Scortum barcoo]